ncbi:structure-specific endonuclease subunit SLX4 [Paroedura picta]|uniref:structure-specific endonuclease subunit SLX4 n=1 Tax=Paroedura picta TaxID=143630 RepID=UPI004056B216
MRPEPLVGVACLIRPRGRPASLPPFFPPSLCSGLPPRRAGCGACAAGTGRVGMDEDDFKELRGRLRRRRGRRRQAQEAEGPGKGDPPPPSASSGWALGQPTPAAGTLSGAEEDEEPTGGGGVRVQLCGREPSGQGAARQQRHANRCLDDMERLRASSTSSISECPLCRKAFSTLESRSSHLKRCAASLAIPPTLMLQVVRQQSSTPGRSALLPTPLSGLKRKVSSCMEQSAKKQKTSIKIGAAEEDLLVAMAMSRSLHEEEETKARLLISGNQNKAQPGRKNLGGKKKRVKPPHSPPTLLLQDPEEARRQTAERVALLLSEVDEFPSTPPLPPSRLVASELSGKENCPLAVSKGTASSLWERSSLIGLSALAPGGVAGLPLPALPWQTDKTLVQSTALGLVIPEVEEKLLQESCGRDLPGKSPGGGRKGTEGCSQEEEGALNDLMELAGEGLTLTQWNPAAQQAEERGQEWVPADVSQSSLDKSIEKKPPLGSCSPSFLLASLASAFKGMVNNPHLSDVQVQVDSGELFYAHLFVLYARCPQLMEVVDQTGIWVAERGEEVKARRVLLSDVSGEAARVFLNYLYTAEHFIPPRVLSDVAALAIRFGVAELVALCTNQSWSGQTAVGDSGQEEEERVEKFEELLKSIWVGEEEEDKVLVPEELGSENVVDVQELEEIYEFAATQRKAKEEERHSSVVAETGAMPGGSSGGEECLGASQWQGQARKQMGPTFPLALLQDSEEQRPLGAVGRRHGEALPELAETPRSLGEQSLPAVAWEGDSLELFHQSYSGREPSNDAAHEDLVVTKASTPLGLLLPRDFPSGGSQVLLGELADRFSSSSPKQRGGFGSDLSLALFSPAPQEARGKPCQLGAQQRATSAGTAASGVTDNLKDAPVPPCSPVALEMGPEKWQTEAPGFLPKDGSLGLEGGIPCAQGRGPPLRRMLLGAQARPGGERITLPLNPNDTQVGKLRSAFGPEAQAPGDAQSSHPTQKSAVVLSLKRQSPPPLGHHSPTSSACLPRDGKPVADVVVILDDSEEEAEAQLSWGSSVLEAELPFPEDDLGCVFSVASPRGLRAAKAGSCQPASPPSHVLMRNGTPTEEDGSHPQRLDLGDQSDAMATLPLAQRLSKTPDLVRREGEVPCTTPLTPMPSYSIMETPVLKKELSRFGVRTLPKPQMVLKLKEIFQYTHRRSEPRDVTASSQLGLSSGTQAAPRPPPTAACTGCPGPPQQLLAGGCLGGSSGAGDQGQMAKQDCLPSGSRSWKRAVEGAHGLVASQKVDSLAGSGTDTSLLLRSSSTEFETSLLAEEEEEEEEEDTPAFRSACRAEVLVALRKYIYSRPALCRQILFYQPFELARLQSELKQNGIRIALGRLLEFLDTHCITFTTAEARREKQKQRRHREGGKRRRY